MKRFSINLLAFVMALFTSQGIMAQEVLFEESFHDGFGQFVIEGGNSQNQNIWVYQADFSAITVDPYYFIDVNENYLAYLVSPEITLGTGNTASLELSNKYFVNVVNEIGVCIRLAGTTEWTSLEIPVLNSETTDYESTGDIAVPASFEGQNVQFGIKYSAPGKNSAGILNFRNFAVKGTPGGGDGPVPVEKAVIFEESFETTQTYGGDLCGFTQESPTNMTAWDNYGNGAFGTYMGGAEGGNLASCYLVSPEMSLLATNTVKFDYEAINFADANITRDMAFAVREVGGEWEEVAIPNLGNTDYGVFVSSGEILIPEKFNYKNVQIAFKYSSDGDWSTAGQWTIRNLVVMGIDGGSSPVQKVDPEISYDITELTCTMGESFIAPGLNNPNNVAVTYSSSDEAVATVNADGLLTVLAEGVTTIKAVSAETDFYLAGEASYVLTVKAAGSEPEVLFEETFAKDLGLFTQETQVSSSTFWQWFFITQSAYAVGEGNAEDTRLVSPEFMLASDNVAKFSYRAGDFTDLANQVQFSVREVGGEWTNIQLPVLNNELIWQDVEINIPAEFNNKNVQVAFWYKASNGAFCVKNLSVIGIKGAAPVEKADPQISFEVGEVEAQMGVDFTAPVLNNPNNVEVVYSSKKPEVATVDPQTGAVTLVGEGFTTITATSVENDQYYSSAVNYVLTVTPASTSTVIFKESFQGGLGDFTVEGYNGENENIWSFKGSAYADAFGKITDPVENYLVSPVIALGSEGNFAHFDHYKQFFNDMPSEVGFAVRTVGGEWTALTILEYPGYDWTNSGNIEVPAEFNGKEVQFGFKYTAKTSNSAGAWAVLNFMVETTGVVKADPEISFDVTEVSYAYGNVFEAPVLNNPNNVEVVYSSDNEEVATVDAATGEVTFVAAGVAKITATSVETDVYRSSSASYTVTYSVPTGIEGITADDLLNGKVYNLQGVRVDKLGKGVYIVNGKKVVVK